MNFFGNFFSKQTNDSLYKNEIQNTVDTIKKMKQALKSQNAEELTDAFTTIIMCLYCGSKFQLLEGGNIFSQKPIINCPICKKLVVDCSI
jgi:rubrerythrin